MAYAKINFRNPYTGEIKIAPVGFSWTTFLFGIFPALLRGHWAGFFIILLLGVITFGISTIVFAFIYNKMYIKHLIGKGYKVVNATQDLEFLANRIQLALPIEEAKNV